MAAPRGESVVREFLKSAQAAECGPKPKRNLSRMAAPEASPLCASSSKVFCYPPFVPLVLRN